MISSCVVVECCVPVERSAVGQVSGRGLSVVREVDGESGEGERWERTGRDGKRDGGKERNGQVVVRTIRRKERIDLVVTPY
jgi:hypothetical protein